METNQDRLVIRQEKRKTNNNKRKQKSEKVNNVYTKSTENRIEILNYVNLEPESIQLPCMYV